MKKSISVSNLTLDLYLDYVRPAARAAGILEEVPARDDWHEYTAEVIEEAAAAEIAHCMTVACFNANKDSEERTHEQYVENEARQMLYQMEVSIKYRHETAETMTALLAALTAILAPAEEQTTDTEEEEEAKPMKSNGYYNEKVMAKFSAAFHAAAEAVKSGEDLRVRISNSNAKMGAVASVSTLPFLTCPARCRGTCGVSCYAAKLANFRPSVLKSYAHNTALAMFRPDVYWAQVNAAVMAVRHFRFHVSGDIINSEHFARMVEVAENNPATEILAFTKRYEIVNAWISEHGALPSNLHIMFSGWTNLTPDNPHNLPETNIFDADHAPAEGWKICGGNCIDCAAAGVGCWGAQRGDVIAFRKH